MQPTAGLFRDSVSVEAYSGENAYGPVYATAATVACRCSSQRQMVRNTDGEEVVSELTIYVRPADSTAFTPGARVTYATRTSIVLGVAPLGRPGQTDLVKVTCS